MALFDGYDFCHICIPWKSGVGGLIYLTAGVENFRSRPLFEESVPRYYYSVHCVLGGSGHMTFRGKEYEIKAGDMFCVPPRERVKYVADKDDPWYYCWFNFAGEHAQRYANSLGFSMNSTPIRKVKDMEGVGKIFDDLIEGKNNDDKLLPEMERAPYIYKLLSAFFAFMHQESYDIFFDKALFEERSVPYLEAYIREHYNDTGFSLSDSYLPFHMTNHLRDKFIEKYNVTPMQYLTSVRMEHALALLSNESKRMTIAEIASLCGYKDPYYFMRIFKKIYGITAAEYRKKHNRR